MVGAWAPAIESGPCWPRPRRAQGEFEHVAGPAAEQARGAVLAPARATPGRRRASALRRAVVAEGAHPDRAVDRIDPGPAGRVGHGLANAVGTAGEWFDRRAAQRRGTD